VLPLVEGQIAAGMRPYIVTPQGAGSAELYLARPDQEQVRTFSLLRSWQDVRNWRKSILECEPESSADLVHAHAFSAGMAAIAWSVIPKSIKAIKKKSPDIYVFSRSDASKQTRGGTSPAQ
jgi:hypothetical protein